MEASLSVTACHLRRAEQLIAARRLDSELLKVAFASQVGGWSLGAAEFERSTAIALCKAKRVKARNIGLKVEFCALHPLSFGDGH